MASVASMMHCAASPPPLQRGLRPHCSLARSPDSVPPTHTPSMSSFFNPASSSARLSALDASVYES
jgi:hypothetical protein